MQERGLTNAETAQRMREHLPEGEGFSPANISHYRSGRSVPRSSHLEALSQALGVKSSDLVTEAETSAGSKAADESGSAQERRTGREQRAGRKQSSTRRRVSRATSGERAEPAEAVPVLQIEDLGTEVRIRLDQSFPWDTGMRLIQALKASGVT
jgi:transcriptional regulator with XRE-family HTH domain